MAVGRFAALAGRQAVRPSFWRPNPEDGQSRETETEVRDTRAACVSHAREPAGRFVLAPVDF